MDKPNELKAVETLWNTLDDISIIRNVLFKGKFIQNAIKFISDRNSITTDEARDLFLEVCDNIVTNLIQNKQTFRASHVLKNAQINELHYLYDLYQKSTKSSEIRSILYEYLCRNNINFKDDEAVLRAYHLCYWLLKDNPEKHIKCLNSVNKKYNNTSLTVTNMHKVSFPKFMLQSVEWRNDIAIDVFFKLQEDERFIHLIPILDRDCFFSYLSNNEFDILIRRWITEQYLCRAGKSIESTINDPHNFEAALDSLFRRWPLDDTMMAQIFNIKQKDVIRNEFSKLGIFFREDDQICRKINRLFTTHTFEENIGFLKSDEITKYILRHNYIDLLPEKFIDHEYIQDLIKTYKEESPFYNELVLLESLKDLFSGETTLEKFVESMNATTKYIQICDVSFNPDQKELRFMNEILCDNLENFHKIADINSFTRNFFIKLNTQEELPTLEEIIENNHSINLDYIRDEFQNSNNNDYIPNFDDQHLSNTYGEKIIFNYIDYIERSQGVYASYALVMDSIKNSMTVTRQLINCACEEAARMAIANINDENLTNHCLGFLESFAMDTKTIRCYIRLLKLAANKEYRGFERFLNRTIKLSLDDKDIRDVEALEVYWDIRRYENPDRSYLIPFTQNDDWFKLIFIAEYFNYALDDLVSICQRHMKNSTLCDNMIRAISYQAADENSASFSKRARLTSTGECPDDLFLDGKYIDAKEDLFAILLKCNESIVRIDLPFEEFQKFFMDERERDDLLYKARKYNWPVLAVLAATTRLYRTKYCWLTWTILSSNFKWDRAYQDTEEVATAVFEHCLKLGFIKTLDESVAIFYPETAMSTFTKFLQNTLKGNFKDMDLLLKHFVVQLYENDFKINILKGKPQLIPFIIKCLIIHLQYNIKISRQQQEYLACLHRSEIDKFHGKVSFDLMKNYCKILEHTNVDINFEVFYECEKKTAREIDRICDELISSNYFEAAIEVAKLMNKSETDFVFKYWLHMRKTDHQKQASFDIPKYMKYIDIYGLSMDIFIKFLNLVIDDMDECVEKYNIMIFILRNMLKTDMKDFDEMEYEVIHLYLRLKASGVKDVKPLTSLFYDNVIKTEKSLIHNTLYELKAVAQIDDIKISKCLTDTEEIKQLDELMFHLLDINDIIQVMRVQAMFSYAPEDLKILVYMLSVAEGITSIYDITKQERQIISNYGQMLNRFNRFALRAFKTSSAVSMSMNSSNLSMDLNESSILEEPSQYLENKETLQALQGLLYKLKHGTNYGQRIVLIYRTSLFLHHYTFNDLMKIKNPFEFLEIVASSDCENKLLAMNDIMEAMQMTRHEAAQFISKEITVCIIKTRFLQFNKDTVSNSSTLNITASSSSSLSGSKMSLDDIWGFSLSKDLHLILELCKGKTTLLGSYLVKFYKIMSVTSADIPIKSDTFDKELTALCDDLNKSLSPQVMSLKKQNIIRVELLITAHDCYCQECSTEGIGEILFLSKLFINELAEKKNFNLIVKLLCGIARYREMFYCFDILIKNEAFEALLGQVNDKQPGGLKNAILSYLNEYHPNNLEYFKMCASHFLMHTELAKIWKSSAMEKVQKLTNESQVKLTKTGRILTNQIQQLDVPYLRYTKNALPLLNDTITDMIHATEMMSADKKIEMAMKFASYCELIAMQINLLKVAAENDSKICPFVLYREQNAEKSQLIAQYFANYELTIPQAMILNKNVDIPIDYTKAIFCRTLISGDEQYLNDFIGRMELSDLMIENIIKLTQLETITKKQEKILSELCLMVRDVGLKFRLASLLGLKGLLQQLLNDEQKYYYLHDSKYGHADIYH